MALLLLAPENIEHAKSAMRNVFPHVKAAHRAEALAASLSFRTYASLLAAIGPSDPNRLPRFVDLNKLSARLAELGYQAIDPALVVQIARSPTMPFRPWIEFRNGDLQSNNRWFYECQRRNLPLITLETRTKYIKLNWDRILRDPKYDTHLGEDHGALLARRMFVRFQSLARQSPGKPMFDGSSFVGSVENLILDIARDLADAFFVMLVAPADQAIAA
jgi:hypothetical protein